MSQSNVISNKSLVAMCIAAFVGMLSAVGITLAIVMPMMKVGATPAATTANVDPAYAAYVQGYMAANTSSQPTTTHSPAGCSEPTSTLSHAAPAASTVSYKTGGMGMGTTPEKMHDSYKDWVKKSYTTNNYHSKKSYVSNVNSNNTIDSNNRQDNSTHTNVKIKDSFNGKGNEFEVNQETKVNNHSFNKDSYNTSNTQTTNNTSIVNDSYNKTKTEVNTKIDVDKDTTINKNSFNKYEKETNVDIKNSGNNLGNLFPPVLHAQQS